MKALFNKIEPFKVKWSIPKILDLKVLVKEDNIYMEILYILQKKFKNQMITSAIESQNLVLQTK